MSFFRLNQQWYGGKPVTSDAPYYLPVAIAGKSFLIDERFTEWNTVPILRQPQDTSTEPGDQSLTTEGVWRKSRSSWWHGAGQAFSDEQDSMTSQFFSSKGVDVFSDRRGVSLLHDTELVKTSSNTGTFILQVGDYTYFFNRTSVEFSTNLSTWVPIVTGDTGQITSATTNGNTVFYAQAGTGIRSATLGATGASVFSSYAADIVGYANGWLLAANDHVMSTVSSAGTATTLLTHQNSGFDWNCIESAPNAIYLAGNSGDRAEIYSTTVKTDGSGLNVPVWAGNLQNGETINCLSYYGAAELMLIGTSLGFHVARVRQDNSLGIGSLVEIPGGVKAFDARGDSFYFAWKNYDQQSTGLGRIVLSRFTDIEALVPAYASDLMFDGQGTVTSIGEHDGHRVFVVDGEGVVSQTDDYVASGTLDSGHIRMSTVERKAVTSIDMRHDALAANERVSVTVLLDNGNSIDAGSNVQTGSLGPERPYGTAYQPVETFQVRTTLAGDGSSSPLLRRWTLRAVVLPERTDEIVLRVVNKSTITHKNKTIRRSPFEMFLFLKGLESSREPVRAQIGQTSRQVIIDRVNLGQYSEDSYPKWTDDMTFFDGVLTVRMLTLEPTA